jgi:hypothetical protein
MTGARLAGLGALGLACAAACNDWDLLSRNRGSSAAVTPTVHGAASANTAPDALSLTITKPPSAASGDLLVAFVTNQGGTYTATNGPTGWRIIDLAPEDGATTDRWVDTTGSRLRAFYKVAAAAEPASYVFSVSPVQGSHDMTGTIVAVSGANAADPINVANSQYNASATAACPAPVLMPTADRTLVLYACAAERGTNTGTNLPFVPPAGMTEQSSMESTGTYRTAEEIASAPQLHAAAITAQAMLNIAHASVGALVAINPAP